MAPHTEDLHGAFGPMEAVVKRIRVRVIRGTRLTAVLLSLAGVHVPGAGGQIAEPVVYTIRIPSPEAQVAEIEMSIPSAGRSSLEIMMPV
jgi:uncharacterized protein (DUF697 family)